MFGSSMYTCTQCVGFRESVLATSGGEWEGFAAGVCTWIYYANVDNEINSNVIFTGVAVGIGMRQQQLHIEHHTITRLPGELSLLTWIFHWSMIYDFSNLLHYMRVAMGWLYKQQQMEIIYKVTCTRICIINGGLWLCESYIMHSWSVGNVEDILHPICIHIEFATCVGSYAVVKERMDGVYNKGDKAFLAVSWHTTKILRSSASIRNSDWRYIQQHPLL